MRAAGAKESDSEPRSESRPRPEPGECLHDAVDAVCTEQTPNGSRLLPAVFEPDLGENRRNAQRPDYEVREEVLDVHYVRIREGNHGEARMVTIEHDGTVRPLSELISESEIIINGTYQNTDHPINFVTENEKGFLKPGSLIIDISAKFGV